MLLTKKQINKDDYKEYYKYAIHKNYLKILFRKLITQSAGIRPKNVLIPTLSGKPNLMHNAMHANPNEQPNNNDVSNRLISEFIFSPNSLN